MKQINLITLLSLGSALACLVFIFVYFRMPSVIMSTNSIIISEQDQEILKKSSIIEDLDLSIKTGSDTILSLNNEVEKLETQLFDLNGNIEVKIEEIKILNELQTKQLSRYNADTNAATELNTVGIKVPPKDIPPGELASWTTVARTILNLHETITRH